MNKDFDKYSTLEMNGEEFDMIPIEPRHEMGGNMDIESMRDMEDEMFMHPMNQYMPYDPMMDMYDFRPNGQFGGMTGIPDGVPGNVPGAGPGGYPGAYPGTQGQPGGYPGAPNLYPNQPVPGTPSVPGALPNPATLYGGFPVPGMNGSGLPGFYEDAFMAGMYAPNSGRYEEEEECFRKKHKKDYDKDYDKDYYKKKDYYDKKDYDNDYEYHDIRRIMRSIQNYNPGIYRAMRMYGIPYPMANRLIRRIVRLTLMYRD